MAVQFTQEMINGAIITEKQTGVPASITLGQLVLESGYKSPSSLSSLAKDYNNYFGVKAIGGWTGDVTPKMYNSKGQDGATYRAYNSVTEGFLDHAEILQAERYQKYFREAKSVEDYAKGLQAGGYATDPNYASSLIKVIKSNNLTQYDGKAIDISMSTNLRDYYKQNMLNGIDDLENFNTGSESSTVTNTTSSTSKDSDSWIENKIDGVLSTVLFFAVISGIAVVAVVSFMKAFDISMSSMSSFIPAPKVSKEGE